MKNIPSNAWKAYLKMQALNKEIAALHKEVETQKKAILNTFKSAGTKVFLTSQGKLIRERVVVPPFQNKGYSYDKLVLKPVE